VAQVSIVFATEREKSSSAIMNWKYIVVLVVMIHHTLSLYPKELSSTRSKKKHCIKIYRTVFKRDERGEYKR